MFTEYEGHNVFFCCERCKRKFERDPEKYASRLLPAHTQETDQSDGLSSATTDHHHENATVPDHEHDEPDDHDAPTNPAPGGTESHVGHEHQHGDSSTPPLLHWLGNFHPPMTNFPIGVLVAAAIAEILFMWRKLPLFDNAARFGVWFSVLTGVVAAFLGWCFGGFRLVDHDPLLLTHRWLGTAAGVWMVALLWASERARSVSSSPAPSRRLYRVMLFGGAVLVMITGFFGGAMVYGLYHYWS